MEQPDTVRIEPREIQIAPAVPAREITLGGDSRGVTILIGDTGDVRNNAEIMNDLAAQGYESVTATLTAASAGLVETMVAHLAGRGWSAEQVAMIGFGSGARVVLDEAMKRALGAAVSVGSVEDHVVDPAQALRTPWLGLYSGDSESLRLGQDLYHRAEVHTATVTYPHARHGFYWSSGHEADHQDGFDARQRTLEWLNHRVGPPRRATEGATEGGELRG